MLRKHSTDAELKLWQLLRNRKFHGFKFRRQYFIGKYIVDFICIEKKLIVELDGGQHLQQVTYEQQRTTYLESLKYKVIRFWNDDVLKDTESVLEVLYQYLNDPPSSDAVRHLLLPAGEGENRIILNKL